MSSEKWTWFGTFLEMVFQREAIIEVTKINPFARLVKNKEMAMKLNLET